MKHFNFLPLSYDLRARQAGLLWFPAALWGLFAILVWIMRGQQQAFDVGRGFLGVVLPLIGGIMAAYAVVDDPALELQFATPRQTARLLAERLGVVLAVLGITAILYQVYLPLSGTDLAPLGSLAARQLAWLVPCLAMIALGSLLAQVATQAPPAALGIGILWIFEFAFRDGFAASPVGQYLLLFMGALYPTDSVLPANQLVLLALAGLMLVAAWGLLKRQERYI